MRFASLKRGKMRRVGQLHKRNRLCRVELKMRAAWRLVQCDPLDRTQRLATDGSANDTNLLEDSMKVPVTRFIALGLTIIALTGCRREEPAPLKSMPMAGNINPNSKMAAIVLPTFTPVSMSSTSGPKFFR